MKKLLLFLLIIYSVISCTSKEEKIERLVDVHIQNSLLYPESYSRIEMTIDSIKYTSQNPEYIENLFKAKNYLNLRNNCKDLVESYIDLSRTYILPYPTYYEKIKGKEHLESAKKYLEKVKNYNDSLKVYLDKCRSLNEIYSGYWITVKYRAKNEDEKMYFGNISFIVNYNCSEVLYCYDNNALTDLYTTNFGDL